MDLHPPVEELPIPIAAPIRTRPRLPRRRLPLAAWKELNELYPQVRRTLDVALPTDWPGLRAAVGYLFDQPMRPEAILPLACCSAVAGQPVDAVPVSAAVVVGAASLRILDDLADCDRLGQLWRQVGVARAANYAAALQALMFELVNQAPLKPHVIRRVTRALARAYLAVAAGEDADLASQATTLDDYWLSMQWRTGRAYAAACVCGALVATNDAALVEACRGFGLHLGMAIHIFNDLDGIWSKGAPDLAHSRLTLPVLYAASLEGASADELRLIVATGGLDASADRVVELLDRLETRSFLIWAALKEREQALASLAACTGQPGRNVMEAWATGMFGDLDEVLADRLSRSSEAHVNDAGGMAVQAG